MITSHALMTLFSPTLLHIPSFTRLRGARTLPSQLEPCRRYVQNLQMASTAMQTQIGEASSANGFYSSGCAWPGVPPFRPGGARSEKGGRLEDSGAEPGRGTQRSKRTDGYESRRIFEPPRSPPREDAPLCWCAPLTALRGVAPQGRHGRPVHDGGPEDGPRVPRGDRLLWESRRRARTPLVPVRR